MWAGHLWVAVLHGPHLLLLLLELKSSPHLHLLFVHALQSQLTLVLQVLLCRQQINRNIISKDRHRHIIEKFLVHLLHEERRCIRTKHKKNPEKR